MVSRIRTGLLRLARRREAAVVCSIVAGVGAFAFVDGTAAHAADATGAAELVGVEPVGVEAPEPVDIEAPEIGVEEPEPVVEVEPPPGVLDISKVPDALHASDAPVVPNLNQYIQDPAAAVALGKALFWDAAIGSDGVACASCHFHAGADDRLKNQVNPGLARQDDVASAEAFAKGASGAPRTGANYSLRASDFPFHQLANPADRDSAVLYSSDDVVSSQGTFAGQFIAPIKKGRRAKDICARGPSSVFNVAGVGARKVEPRNTPTVINAVFNYRNFWDGRASNVFNGMNPFGLRDTNARILRVTGGKVKAELVALENSSLASQAVGPPLSDFEMSCEGRTFADIAKRVLVAAPLAKQRVAKDDSVLAPYRATSIGLKGTYTDLVKRAFKSDYWSAKGQFSGFTQIQTNFSLFWGLAIQAYEATLVSDAAPFDAWVAAGKPTTASTTPGFGEQELLGLALFVGKGRCVNCHKGPEFTAAGSPLFDESEEDGLVERMLMGDDKVALYDNGFYNIGVTASSWDVGVGGVDPLLGKPLSFSEQYRELLSGKGAPDVFVVDPCTFAEPTGVDCSIPPPLPLRTAVRGSFKVPTLRNVELTGPYMHNGGMATLEQVVSFYDRGGNFKNPELDPDISPIGFTAEEKSAVVAFLRSLTDDRVRYERAPFDHPGLVITHGQVGDASKMKVVGKAGLAQDATLTLREVGKAGNLNPLLPFTPAP